MRLFTLCFFILFWIYPPGIVVAVEHQRVSFAISGGASKGAYEAGLNWGGLTILRHEGERADPILRGRVRPFEAVSMAGASAGGINTLLSAITWCAQPGAEQGISNLIDDNLFRRVWLMPDINTLLPVSPNSSTYRPDDALLARKNLIEAANYLQQWWKSPIFRPGCRIPLGVTVTRTQPEVIQVGDVEVKNQRFTIPFELRVQDDGTVRFFFDPDDYQGLLDYSMILLPNKKGGLKGEIDDEFIKDTVLASGAFPLAFGRKRLQFCRSRTVYTATDGISGQIPQREQMACPAGYELAEAEFADGGLFDNLPIGLARTLAEENVRAKASPYPVTYVYIDPNRRRFALPEGAESSACMGPNPPGACREMEYSLLSEGNLLMGAWGTARNYELYRELTSETWAHNLTQLSLEMGGLLEADNSAMRCSSELPFYAQTQSCAQALRLAGRFLAVAYNRVDAPITAPFSVDKLRSAGIASRCKTAQTTGRVVILAECEIDHNRYRRLLAEGMDKVLQRMPSKSAGLIHRVRTAKLSLHNDRVIRVTSRGAPITGEMLGAFAGFLDEKFRLYDYYVGVYDAVVIYTHALCSHHFTPRQQAEEYLQCREAVAENYYQRLGVDTDPKARYVFALLAKWEFGAQGSLKFAYTNMPATDPDMQIIHDGLQSRLQARSNQLLGVGQSRPEIEFFTYLKTHKFKPSAVKRGKPLMADILEDPEYWGYELSRRVTARMIVLEQRADNIFARREPNVRARPDSSTVLIGGVGYALRSATYKYPPFDFSPSTAPSYWYWRNIIPYEIAFDIVEGRGHVVWQPTLSLSRSDILGLRIAVPISGSVTTPSARINYYSLGLDYTHLSGKQLFSSYGLTPGYFYTYDTATKLGNYSLGADVHMGIISNKLRVSVGVRDLSSIQNSWFVTVGLMDVPGIAYWFSR